MRSITSDNDAPCRACIVTKLRTASAISSRPPYPTAIVNVIKWYCAVATSAARIAATTDCVPCGLHEPRIIGWPGFFGALHADGHDEGSKCRKDGANEGGETTTAG